MVIIKNTNECIKKINFTGKLYSNTVNFVKFVKNNKTHRYYGPAVTDSDTNKFWWLNNDCFGTNYNNIFVYSQKQFLKDISKRWLL